MYKIGDRVCFIERGQIGGTIKNIIETNSTAYLEIMLDTNQSVMTTSNNVVPFEAMHSPIEMMKHGQFGTMDEFIVENVLNKLDGKNNDIVASLKSSRTKFMPYQFIPLMKFFKSDKRRILIADEVGLGKTMEAGYILSELYLRGTVRNCLVVCTNSLRKNWQSEMRDKFGIEFNISEKAEVLIKNIEDDIKNEIDGLFTITSFNYGRKRYEQLNNLFEKNNYSFDLVIVDEAHILRNDNNLRYGFLKKVLARSSSTILLSATPVMTSLENLYNIVKLLDATYDNHNWGNIDIGYFLFNNQLELSRPFIRALNRVTTGENPKSVIEDLKNQTVRLSYSSKDSIFSNERELSIEDRFKNDDLFKQILEIGNKDKILPADIALLQYNLTELNSFHDIVTRTKKRHVAGDEIKVVERVAYKISVGFTDVERDYYKSVLENFDQDTELNVLAKKHATSCLPAYIAKKDIGHHSYEEIKEIDSKYEALRRILNEIVVDKKKKIIIFAFYTETLKYLKSRLGEEGLNTYLMYGDTTIEERNKIVHDFKFYDDTRILLSSEVGQEGINLQFCNAMVNYDLPWNPMTIEQRIGRIDRIGQEEKYVYIYNLCIENTIEERIYTRLFERIRIFEDSIGIVEDILETDDNRIKALNSLEKDIYGTELTDEQIDARLKELEIATEYLEQTKSRVTKNLEGSMLDYKYLSQEIRNINQEGRYITESDIRHLISLLFYKRLATIRCDLYSEDKTIRWDEHNGNELIEFLNNNLPSKMESPALFRSRSAFIKRIQKSNDSIRITLNQDEAFSDPTLEYISSTHPIAQAGYNFFKNTNSIKNKAYFFCIKHEDAPTELRDDPFMIMAKYRFMERRFNPIENLSDTKAFEMILLLSLNEHDNFEVLPEDKKIALLSSDQSKWFTNPNYTTSPEDSAMIVEKMSPALIVSFVNEKQALMEKMSSAYKSKWERTIETEIDFLERRISLDMELLVKDPNNSINNIVKDRIAKYEKRIRELGHQRKLLKIEFEDSLQSISMIQII